MGATGQAWVSAVDVVVTVAGTPIDVGDTIVVDSGWRSTPRPLSMPTTCSNRVSCRRERREPSPRCAGGRVPRSSRPTSTSGGEEAPRAMVSGSYTVGTGGRSDSSPRREPRPTATTSAIPIPWVDGDMVAEDRDAEHDRDHRFRSEHDPRGHRSLLRENRGGEQAKECEGGRQQTGPGDRQPSLHGARGVEASRCRPEQYERRTSRLPSAELDAGGGLHLGLHPKSGRGPAPGTPGGITVGLAVDEPIAQVIETLKNRGVIVEGPVMGEGGLSLAFFSDPDGNPLYLAETAEGRS